MLRAGFSRTSEDGTKGPGAPEGSGAARVGSKAAEISGGTGDGSRECVLEQRLRDLGRALTAADEAQRVLAERAAAAQAPAAASPQPAAQVAAAGGAVGEAEGSEVQESPAAGALHTPGSRRERWLEGRVKVGALPSAPPARAREEAEGSRPERWGIPLGLSKLVSAGGRGLKGARHVRLVRGEGRGVST